MNSTGLPQRVRTLFLSDLHLGCRLSRGPRCLEALGRVRAEQIFLLGDVVDASRLSRLWHWPDSHQRVVDAICDINRLGTRVSLAPGNHDECFRDRGYFNNLKSRNRTQLERIVAPLLEMNVAESHEYETLSGRRLWLTHGDLFDTVDAHLGGIPNWGSRVFDRVSWHFPNQVTHGLRSIFKWILARPDQVEAAIVAQAGNLKFDGVVFGHLHQPQLKALNGLIIANTGDWILNESFLVETLDGRLQLFDQGKIVAEIGA